MALSARPPEQAAVRKPPVQTGERDGYWNADSSYHGVPADAFGVGLALATSSPAVRERLLPLLGGPIHAVGTVTPSSARL